MQTVTLQEFILAVAEGMRELSVGTTTATAALANQLVDSDLQNNRNKFWVDSEIILLEPGATAAGRMSANPFTVRDFDSATGTLTLDKDFAPGAGVPQGIEYAILRPQGRGAPYRAYLKALKQALVYYGSYTDVIDGSMGTLAYQYGYTLLSNMDKVWAVKLLDNDTGISYGLTAGIHWWLESGRQLVLSRNVPVEGDYNLLIYGLKNAAVPDSLTGTLRIDYDDVLEYTIELLQRGSPRQIDAARSGNQQQERLRFRKRIPYPNEQEII